VATDPLQADKEAAAKALQDDAGCLPDRARTLVDAYALVVAQEAVAVIAGTADIGSSVLDTRVSRLRRLVDALPKKERFPDVYELGAIFKITVSQARNVIRTYQARHPSAYRARLEAGVHTAVAKAERIGKRDVWVVEFDDPDALDYAYDLLRRQGLMKGLERDRSAQRLVVPRDVTGRGGEDAVAILRCKKKNK
jgi:hypothetical protein